MKQKSPLIVVGMHRSGTSAICLLLEKAGYSFGDDLIQAAEDNPLGFWESKRLISLNEQLGGGADSWQYIKLTDCKASDGWKLKADSFVCDLIEHAHAKKYTPALKDPRMCRFLNNWFEIITEKKVVFVIRDPIAVAKSLRKRNDISISYGLALWFVYNFEAIKSIVESGVDYICVEYEKMVSGAYGEAKKFYEFLEVPIPDSLPLDSNLQHHTRSEEDLSSLSFMEESVSSFYDFLRRGDFEKLKEYQAFHQSLLEFFDSVVGLKESQIKKVKEEKKQEEESYKMERRELLNIILESQDKIFSLGEDKQRLYDKYKEVEKVRWEVDVLLLGVYNSKSWKLTRPFRSVAKNIKLFGYHLRKISLPLRWARNYFKFICSKASFFAMGSRQNKKAMHDLVDERPAYADLYPQSCCETLPEITISVVTYNNGEWLESFFDSLCKQAYPTKKINIKIVDNSSGDGTYEKIKSLEDKVSSYFNSYIFFSRPNLGFGAGHDFAIRMATTDYVLVSNVDLEFEANSILNAVKYAISDDCSASWEFRQLPYEHPKMVDPVTLHVNWSSHACILMDRSAYLAVGGYEKRIFMYGEDVELSYRFRSKGYKLAYLPASVVYHYTYETEGEVKPVQFVGSITSNFLIRCRYGMFSDILVGGGLFLAVLFRGKGFDGSRMALIKSAPKMLLAASCMLATRCKSTQSFPFRGFDYDLIREGAFWTGTGVVIEDSNPPLITVITRTVSGREGLLKQAIKSVVNQTYANIEHIIVEDGGVSCSAICDEYSLAERAGYSIRHLGCDKKGRSYAANRAFEEARGDYFLILDDDDLLFPDHLETLYIELLNSDADGSYSLAWDTPVSHMDKVKGSYKEEGHFTLPIFYQEFEHEVLMHHNYLPIQSVLFRRELYDLNGGFEEDMDFLEDWVFWCKITKNAKFKFVKKTTSMFKTPATVSESYKRKKQLDGAYIQAKERIANILT